MNYIDLFHGIGGFALGAYWAGMKFDNHFCSDIEPYTQNLYKLRFPDSIQLGDISKIDTNELKKYGDNWIISGGFPCQDISIAGKGEGIHGKRSGLWFEYWRLINNLRPKFAIMENVGMLIHRGLREVLGSLAEIGYNAEWTNISANDMGLPHKRERLWIIAYPNSEQCAISQKRFKEIRLPFCTIEANIREGKYKPAILGKNDGIPHRVDKLKGLGNAIVPQIAEILFKQIKPLL